MPLVAILWSVVAFAASCFYGYFAPAIFSVTMPKKDAYGHYSMWVHQFWLNFLGSLIGWIAGWPLLVRGVECTRLACNLNCTPTAAVLALVAFVGMTGHLPLAVIGAVTTLGQVAAKILGIKKED